MKIGRIIDGTARTAGIDFQVEKVMVCSSEEACWSEAIMKLLDFIFSIQKQLQED